MMNAIALILLASVVSSWLVVAMELVLEAFRERFGKPDLADIIALFVVMSILPIVLVFVLTNPKRNNEWER